MLSLTTTGLPLGAAMGRTKIPTADFAGQLLAGLESSSSVPCNAAMDRMAQATRTEAVRSRIASDTTTAAHGHRDFLQLISHRISDRIVYQDLEGGT